MNDAANQRQGDAMDATKAREPQGSLPQGSDLAEYVLPGYVLDRNGKFPLPFAVVRVEVDPEAERVSDAFFLYASEEYCRSISRDPANIVGRSCFETGEGDRQEWLSQCYRVVVHGETVLGFGYDPLVRDWISYSLAPSAAAGCCVYTFTPVVIDEQQRRQLMATTNERTSYFVSEMLSELSAEQSYDAAMNGMLQRMSTIVHAERLSVFECDGRETKTTFELCAKGVEPQLGLVFPASREVLVRWFRNVTTAPVILVPHISIIERFSAPLYQWCVASGVQSLMAAPFFIDGEIVGFLGAYNYQIDETIDLEMLFDAVSTFVAARIENRQLIDSLQRASSHDTLTDLLNRRGAQLAIDELFESDPDGHFVLALIDLDDFKRVNDVYGHAVGDEALRAMTRTLVAAFPTDAILSRNGGDEFLVVLSGDAAANASSLLANLTRRGLDFEFEGDRHHLTLSVGYARHPEQAESLRELVSRADTALYAVKLSGKAGFGKYTAEAEDHMRLQLGFSARDLLEHAPYPMLVSRADEQGDLLFASTECALLLGYSGLYDLTRNTRGAFAALVHPDDRAAVMDNLAALDRGLPDGKSHFVFRALTKGDGVRSVYASFRFVDIEETGRVLYTFLSPGRQSDREDRPAAL